MSTGLLRFRQILIGLVQYLNSLVVGSNQYIVELLALALSVVKASLQCVINVEKDRTESKIKISSLKVNLNQDQRSLA